MGKMGEAISKFNFETNEQKLWLEEVLGSRNMQLRTLLTKLARRRGAGGTENDNNDSADESDKRLKEIYFEKIHILRGGKERICICPGLFWPDYCSLILKPEDLNRYLQSKSIRCDTLTIWNFNKMDLHKGSAADDHQPEYKTRGTAYDRLLPAVLAHIQRINPRLVEFESCDFEQVNLNTFTDFVMDHCTEIQEMFFDDCQNVPLQDSDFDVPERRKRRLSTIALDHIKQDDIIMPKKSASYTGFLTITPQPPTTTLISSSASLSIAPKATVSPCFEDISEFGSELSSLRDISSPVSIEKPI